MKTPDVKLGFQTLFLFIRKTATREIRSAQKFKNTSNTQYLGTVVNFNSYGTVSCITQNNPHFSDNSPFWFPITVMTHSVCVHAGESLPRRDTTPLLHRLHRFFCESSSHLQWHKYHLLTWCRGKKDANVFQALFMCVLLHFKAKMAPYSWNNGRG